MARQLTEGLLIDYRHFDDANITPRYAFGFRLSYTTFNVSDLSITSSSTGLSPYPANMTVQPGGHPDLYKTVLTTTSVSNTGAVAGSAVVQLYLSLPSSAPAETPVKVLQGFEKVPLSAGETQAVSLN
jgi:beta-glucosidase